MTYNIQTYIDCRCDLGEQLQKYIHTFTHTYTLTYIHTYVPYKRTNTLTFIVNIHTYLHAYIRAIPTYKHYVYFKE